MPPKNFGILATHLREGKDLTTASRAVMQIPRDAWDKEQAGPVAEAILAWAKTVPGGKRTEQDFVETVQVGMDMASMLPAQQSTPIRKGLIDLGVRVFAIKTIREAMRYRHPSHRGGGWQALRNHFRKHGHDAAQPGHRRSREPAKKSGMEAQTMKPEPDKNGRMYIPPKNKKIIAATKLVEPGQKETLKLLLPQSRAIMIMSAPIRSTERCSAR